MVIQIMSGVMADDPVEGVDLMDAKHITNQTCPVCGKPVAPERLARYPSAVVCGRRTCTKQHRRTASNRVRKSLPRPTPCQRPGVPAEGTEAGEGEIRERSIAAWKNTESESASRGRKFFPSDTPTEGSAGGSVYLRMTTLPQVSSGWPLGAFPAGWGRPGGPDALAAIVGPK